MVRGLAATLQVLRLAKAPENPELAGNWTVQKLLAHPTPPPFYPHQNCFHWPAGVWTANIFCKAGT